MRRLFVPALVTVSPKSKENRGANNSLKMEYLEIPSDPATFNRQAANILTTRCQTLDGAYYEVYDLQSGRRLAFEDIVEPGKLPPSGEPNLGLLANGIIYNGAETPYSQLKGVLKPQFLP